MFLQFSKHQCLKTRERDLIAKLVLQLFLIPRHVGFSSFDPRFQLQKRAPSSTDDRPQKLSFPSSCRRIVSFLQSSPCLQRVPPRVGDNVLRFTTRVCHECCMHLLQHELQVRATIHVRHCRQEFNVNGFPRDFRCQFSWPRQHHLRPTNLSSEKCLRFLRPLLKILLCAREFFRATKACRSVFLSLDCRLMARTASASPV